MTRMLFEMLLAMSRQPGPVPPAPSLQALLAAGVQRDRAVLAVRIGELRVDRGWTHYALGQVAGLHGTYLKEVERGIRNPSLDQLLRLARAFKLISLEQLFGQLPTEELI